MPHAGCPHRCSFCDQSAITGRQTMPGPADVIAAAERALETMTSEEAKGAQIAFFGGSFTAIDRSLSQPLLQAAGEYVKKGVFGGIRLSTRPDCVDKSTLTWLKGYGVTAVELGAQSMDDRVLQKNGRGHTAEDTRRASYLIKAAGMELGLQMMTGLDGDTDEGACQTARALAALSPDTMRIYPTVVLKGTALYERMQKGLFCPQGLEGAVMLCARLLTFFEGQGIPVIRLGLHDSSEVRANLAGGAFHPAFRELCEGELYRQAACKALQDRPRGAYLLRVAPGCLSKMTGQGRRNLIGLQKAGYSCRVEESAVPARYEVLCDGPV